MEEEELMQVAISPQEAVDSHSDTHTSLCFETALAIAECWQPPTNPRERDLFRCGMAPVGYVLHKVEEEVAQRAVLLD